MSESDRAARYSDLFAAGEHQEHVSNCAYCPICAGIGVLRDTQPELLDHLAAAARELIVAARMIFEEAERHVADAQTPPGEDTEGSIYPISSSDK
jgi:hypothetical protein